MGDTLVHLRSYGEVETLCRDVLGVLEGGGALVLEFRDATREFEGVDRAIPLRMDDERIMATFLEYETNRINVHDMVFVRGRIQPSRQQTPPPSPEAPGFRSRG